jgi:hypothetical protein
LQSSYSNENFLGGDFTGIITASYARPLYAATTPETTDPFPYQRSCGFDAASSSCANQGSGRANVRDNLAFTFVLSQTWGKWNPSLFFRSTHAFPYQFKEVTGSATAQGTPGVRNLGYFAAALDYSLNDWFTPEVGYQMSRALLSDDGTYGNPIFSNYQDARIYIGANIQLDSLYKSVAGAGGSAGVVRAKNRTPILFQ